MYVIGYGVIFAVGLSSYFIGNLTYMVVSISLFASLETISCQIFSVIINESMHSKSKHRARSVAYFCSSYAIGGPLLGLISYLVNNGELLILIYTLATLVVVIPFFIFIYEPAKRLHRLKKISLLYRNLHKISKCNSHPISIQEMQEFSNVSNVDLEKDTYSLRSMGTCAEKTKSAFQSFTSLFCTRYVISMTGYFI